MNQTAFLHVDFKQPKELEFNRARLRRAFVQIGRVYMRDARRLVIKRGRSDPGENPGYQTGRLARSIGYYVPKKTTRRPGLMVKISPNQKNGQGNRRFPEGAPYYPAFLYYGVRHSAYGMDKKDKRQKKHHSSTFRLTEMNDSSGRWSYARQLYGHVYTAKLGTLSELVDAGDMHNQQHITLAGYEKETQSPVDELVASRLAREAVFIRNDPARPTQTGELVGMLPAPKGKRFIMTEQQTLLSHGVATAYVEGGTLRIQRSVTTYKKNAYGVADNSYLDSETLHTSAYVLRKLKSVITSKYGRHKLANDGTRFGPGQAIVTPAVIKGELLATYRQMERAGIVENYDLFKQYLIVERDADNPNRLNTLFPPDYVNQLRVFAVVNQFRLQYSEESA